MSRPTTSRSRSTPRSSCAGPLLVKGEPGTGKTVLAHEIADGARRAADRMAHQVDHPRASRASTNMTRWRGFATASSATSGSTTSPTTSSAASCGTRSPRPELPVLLIDEIDKADIEFPNDLLQELDRMEFHVYETGETVKAVERPIVVITSNNEKELPDAFLRRCFFHYIRFPDRETMTRDHRRPLPRHPEDAGQPRARPVLRGPRRARASRRSRRPASCSTG